MARYSIDGQILTDMADIVRDAKGYVIHNVSMTSIGNNQSEASRGALITPSLKKGNTYKMTFTASYARNSEDSFYYVTPTITANSKEGPLIYNDSVYQDKETVIIFTATVDITTINFTVAAMNYITPGKIRIEPCDEDGNSVMYFTPGEMVDLMPTFIKIPSQVTLTSSQRYGCAGPVASEFLKLYPDTVSTDNVSDSSYMFYNYKGKEIPFEINFAKTTTTHHAGSFMFSNCTELERLPTVVNFRPGELKALFQGCYNLREIPDEWVDSIDFSYIDSLGSSYAGDSSSIFNYCQSLRKIPMKMLQHGNPVVSYSYNFLYSNFSHLYALDELVNLPIIYNRLQQYTSNLFSSNFNYCSRLKNLTFLQYNEELLWRGQTIDLTKNVGYATSYQSIIDYNSGITIDKQVTDDDTYQALKNDPDWFTTDINYSRYNKESALETIKSLPNTYSFINGTTYKNTIKFKGQSGAKTDGGAINTLSDSEIAIAAAKGWTVALV